MFVQNISRVSIVIAEAGTPYTISLTAQNLCGVSDPSTKTFFAGEKSMVLIIEITIIIIQVK